jgi:hypothetical protein
VQLYLGGIAGGTKTKATGLMVEQQGFKTTLNRTGCGKKK